MFSRPGVLNAFPTNKVFNLWWVYWDISHCMLGKICINSVTFCGFSFFSPHRTPIVTWRPVLCVKTETSYADLGVHRDYSNSAYPTQPRCSTNTDSFVEWGKNPADWRLIKGTEKKLSLEVVPGMPGMYVSRISMHTVSVFPPQARQKALKN